LQSQSRRIDERQLERNVDTRLGNYRDLLRARLYLGIATRSLSGRSTAIYSSYFPDRLLVVHSNWEFCKQKRST